MWIYALFLVMIIYSCFFVTGDVYFKIYSIVTWIIIAYMYNLIEYLLYQYWCLSHNVYEMDDFLAKVFKPKGLEEMDAERLERIRKRLFDVPEKERSDLFDCFENGYILLENGYRVFKPYPGKENNNE